jgi:pimeloyl-ACP methyl ester carboxylesterase
VADISIGEESVSSIKEDTLIIHGTEDKVVNVENSKEIRDILPCCELEKIDGAGHSFEGVEEELVERARQFSD